MKNKKIKDEMMKKDFIKELKKEGVFSTEKEAKEKLDAILDILSKNLMVKDCVSFVGFGKFSKTIRKEKVNVKSHLKTINTNVNIPEIISVKFNIGKNFKDSLNS